VENLKCKLKTIYERRKTISKRIQNGIQKSQKLTKKENLRTRNMKNRISSKNNDETIEKG
jgi:hypothetical protein